MTNNKINSILDITFWKAPEIKIRKYGFDEKNFKIDDIYFKKECKFCRKFDNSIRQSEMCLYYFDNCKNHSDAPDKFCQSCLLMYFYNQENQKSV